MIANACRMKWFRLSLSFLFQVDVFDTECYGVYKLLKAISQRFCKEIVDV